MSAALCGPAPEGYARWSLRLLSDQAVALGIVDAPNSYDPLRQTLPANELKPWLRQEWCIRPEPSGEFVCPMEDIKLPVPDCTGAIIRAREASLG